MLAQYSLCAAEILFGLSTSGLPLRINLTAAGDDEPDRLWQPSDERAAVRSGFFNLGRDKAARECRANHGRSGARPRLST